MAFISVAAAAVQQLEYYFGDSKYLQDAYLRSLADRDGWVKLAEVCRFKRMQGILGGCHPTVVAQQLESHKSLVVQLDTGRGWLVRRRPLRSRLKMQLEFYFRPDHYAKDAHLQQLVAATGFAPLSAICAFKRVQAAFQGDGIFLKEAQLKEAALVVEDSRDLELSPDRLAVRPAGRELRARRQLEYYFGDANYPQDEFLQEVASEHPEGFVFLEEILLWPRMRALEIRDPQCVASTLVDSSVVEVSPDGLWVRRRMTGPSQEVQDVEMGDPPGALSELGPSWDLMPPFGDEDFSAVSFNILAPTYALGRQHDGVPHIHRQWRYRRDLLLKAFERATPSIVALQEVQQMVAEDLLRSMAALGYDGHYSPKVDVHGKPMKHKETLGVAIFWLRSVFAQEAGGGSVIPFAPLLAAECTVSEVQHTWFAELPHVAVACLLRHLASGRRLLAASTHITCDYKNRERQVAQVAVLLRRLGELSSSVAGSGSAPVLLLGDFNSPPGSAVYRLLKDGALSPAEVWGRHAPPSPAPVELPAFMAGGPRHSLKLESTHRVLSESGQEPAFTTIRGPFSADGGYEGCLDYVWYGQEGLRPVAALPIPPKEVATGECSGGLPNSWCPSDHLPLGGAFRFV